MAGAGSIYVVIIVFIQDVMHSVTKDLSLLGLFFGMGFFLGSVVYGRYGQKIPRSRAIFTSLAASGLMIGIFALFVRVFPNFYVASSLIMIMGMVAAPCVISANTLVHEVTHEQMRGRIFTSLGVVMSIALLAFMFITSALAEHIERMYILVFVGVIFVICGALGIVFTGRRNQVKP
jgi:MFS family permease